jgi:protein gp37
VDLLGDKLADPILWRRPACVFVNSMSDLFHARLGFHEIAAVYSAMRVAHHHAYIVLTKRPATAAVFLREELRGSPEDEWPNVAIGYSASDQRSLDAGAGQLLECRAACRVLSLEPLIGPVDLSGCIEGVHWVIVGGESGPGARKMQPEWVASVVVQCQCAGVPVFFKQWGSAAASATEIPGHLRQWPQVDANLAGATRWRPDLPPIDQCHAIAPGSTQSP